MENNPMTTHLPATTDIFAFTEELQELSIKAVSSFTTPNLSWIHPIYLQKLLKVTSYLLLVEFKSIFSSYFIQTVACDFVGYFYLKTLHLASGI